ncbi:hypothetical protein K4L06_03250 [Lysobacter sp. BMK333-48F3]|uniref:hypothetical protein n=1 Tax=Lysobacter sp. BMK333-48F3 TaxID=2867962 RepID=UPI001C8B0FBA|nr:hypothetical protein [Lysobacter sp. BMK333-48F3]MBX9400312.1 hypothetical protein [Lysobacter sp. BMK333-48F3]
MRKDVWFCFALLAAAASPVALAQSADAAADTAAAAAPTAAAARSVPKLSIRWDCGECEHNDKVPPLIEQAYAEQAAENEARVSDNDVAEVAIVDIRQRPPGVRVMFGVMAGRDRLGLRVKYRDRVFEVSDTSANIVMGLNHLSASVGKSVFEELSSDAAR